VDAIVVVADATTVRERAQDRYVGDVVTAQLSAADLLVLASRDRVDDAGAAQLTGWLQTLSPAAPIAEAVHGAVPPEVILGIDRVATPWALTGADVASTASSHRARSGGTGEGRMGAGLRLAADRRFQQLSHRLDQPHDPHRLAAALAAPGLGLLRAKAIVDDGRGQLHVVQLAGGRCDVSPLGHAVAAEGPGARRSGLVCIGLHNRLNAAAIEAALATSRL
jgi:G3E family GTPase